MIPQPEPHLIELAVAGDSAAFRSLVELYRDFVFKVAYRFVNNADDAQDIAQEIFIRLWTNLRSYRKDVKLSTWLYRITTNYCIDHVKSARYRSKKKEMPAAKQLNIPMQGFPDDLLLQDELRDIVARAANELTGKQKAVFILRDMEELSMTEIGEILNMDNGRIKSNLYYARKKIVERVNQYYSEAKKPMI